VTLLSRLAARLLGGTEIISSGENPAAIQRALALAPRRRGRHICLVIAPQPAHLVRVLRAEHWLRGYQHVVGWVIDSWWDDRIPRVARGLHHYDHIFVTEREVVDSWRETTGTPVTWLPFGTDALDMGTGDPVRPVDLQRFGRQPTSWDDDATNAAEAKARGFNYRGRPPFLTDPVANQRTAMAAFGRAKFTLSFTNRVSPAAYTHPTREYLTGRWTDALASGASVVGMPPACASVRDLLWPTALVELTDTHRDTGLDVVASAVDSWTPSVASTNHHLALERLDWRWRLQEIAKLVQITPGPLEEDLARLHSRIADTQPDSRPPDIGPRRSRLTWEGPPLTDLGGR